MNIPANPFGCTHGELEYCDKCTEFVVPDALVAAALRGAERRNSDTGTQQRSVTE